MSDDLVKRLRKRAHEPIACTPFNILMESAADRIEELEDKLRNARMSEFLALGQSQEAYEQQLAAEAKLAKAVAQMQRVKDFRYDPNIGIELNFLEAILAELTGGNDG